MPGEPSRYIAIVPINVESYANIDNQGWHIHTLRFQNKVTFSDLEAADFIFKTFAISKKLRSRDLYAKASK